MELPGWPCSLRDSVPQVRSNGKISQRRQILDPLILRRKVSDPTKLLKGPIFYDACQVIRFDDQLRTVGKSHRRASSSGRSFGPYSRFHQYSRNTKKCILH